MSKSRPSFPAASWLALAIVGSTDPTVYTAEAAVKVGCEIRATRSDAGTRLDAIISASGKVSGTYSFRVEPRGSGKPMSEEGRFDIESPTPSEVKKVALDLLPGAGYDASLKIRWPNGSSSCSASVS
jgi:hypothetical protein